MRRTGIRRGGILAARTAAAHAVPHPEGNLMADTSAPGDDQVSFTGLTDDQARELHEVYLKGFYLFTAVAVLAHLLVLLWRPWF
jgi:light-harvesting complex 1 beta chain